MQYRLLLLPDCVQGSISEGNELLSLELPEA